MRYYAHLSPLLILFAAWGIQAVARRAGPALFPQAGGRSETSLAGRKLAACLLFVVLASPMVVGWIKLDGPPPKRDLTRSLVDTWRSHMRVVAQEIAPREVVLSNAPWCIAWRAERPSVPLPLGPALMPLLAREYRLDVGGIYFTPRTIGSWETPNWDASEAVRAGKRRVPGFRVARRFRDGALLLVKERAASPHPIPQGQGDPP